MFFYLVISFLPSWGVDFLAAFSRSFFWLRFVTLFRLDSDPCKLGDTNKTERQGVALHFCFRVVVCVCYTTAIRSLLFLYPFFLVLLLPPSHFFGWSYFVIWASPFYFIYPLLAFSRLPIRINVWNKVLFCFVLLFDFFSRIWYRRQLKMLPSWEASKTGSMSFKIRTNEPNGLLLYNNGAPHAQVCVVCRFWLWVRWWARFDSSHQRFIVPILFLIVLL